MVLVLNYFKNKSTGTALLNQHQVLVLYCTYWKVLILKYYTPSTDASLAQTGSDECTERPDGCTDRTGWMHRLDWMDPQTCLDGCTDGTGWMHRQDLMDAL